MYRLLFHESPNATYRPIMWSVGRRNGDMKEFYIILPFLIIMLHYESVLFMLIKPAFILRKIQKKL